MDKDYLIRLIREYNPGLEGRAYPVLPVRRDLYDEIGPWLYRKQAVAIVGLRRTGKTTLMRQVQDLLPGTSAFFSFDEEETREKEVLVFVLDYMITTLDAKNILLDEIQYVDDWEGVLKRYYDQRALKFILSGSESLDLFRAKAALAGRIATFILPPLSFREYLRLRGVTFLTGTATLNDYPSMKRLYEECITRKEYFEHEFTEYLYKGAFPELVEEKDGAVIRNYINDLVVKKILYRDIPSIFEIRRPDLLLGLFRVCGKHIIADSSISRTLPGTLASMPKPSRTTSGISSRRSSYGLPNRILRVPQNGPGGTKNCTSRTPPSRAPCSAMTGSSSSSRVLGPYVETLFAGRYFWRDRYKREVDVVHETREGLLPIEIKYQAGITNSDTRNLRHFMGEHHVSPGILITKDLLDREIRDGTEILYIPAWLALLAQTF